MYLRTPHTTDCAYTIGTRVAIIYTPEAVSRDYTTYIEVT